MVRKRDTFTFDLFRDLQPEPVVERFAGDEVKAWSLSGRLAKAIALTMEDSDLSREEIAAAMSDITKASISKATLDAYSSQAKEQNQIPAVRLAALVAVTGDARALNVLLEEAGLIVIPKKYEALLKRERAREMRELLEREEKAADAEWRAKR
ncbi:Hypothetical protein NGAL_HAMBI1145_09460 [Neorhizobium galegae bv. officinalis]|uniref:Uncharacterized protein n=1 Tax=Neorhizobium galegae bv. officinalis TaxID=323656 RepID=A0A0T7FAW4_NEOGA|nr:hypothetical protein [Neorhizobium galegae]CDZ32175.1 Hypothetical protein NGAL_HAMBI1145_09460 [Neorhizobium galegae bv. officinalis]